MLINTQTTEGIRKEPKGQKLTSKRKDNVMRGRYTDLKGKNIIVIGTGGIGGAIVKDFLYQGCRVFALDRNQKTLSQLRASLRGKQNFKIQSHVVDVTNHERFTKIIKEIGNKHKPIHSFVYTAGIGTSTPVDSFVEGLPEKLFSINVVGFIYGLKAIIPFLENGSSVIAIGSLNASRSEPGMAVYDATKSALTQYARTASVDLGSKGIRVNVVAPGYINTPQTVKELEDPANVEKIINATSLRRIGQPSDISSVVVALASDDFKFVTGTVIAVDGGLASAQYSPVKKQVNE